MIPKLELVRISLPVADCAWLTAAAAGQSCALCIVVALLLSAPRCILSFCICLCVLFSWVLYNWSVLQVVDVRVLKGCNNPYVG